jgi:hypothetical protein
MKNKKPPADVDIKQAVQIFEISDRIYEFIAKIVEENPDIDADVIISSILTVYFKIEHEISRSISSKAFSRIIKKGYEGIKLSPIISDE